MTLRLTVDLAALAANFRTLQRLGGAAHCGAAVKANAYGLGAIPVARRLVAEGCRHFFVASLAEAKVLRPIVEGADLYVLSNYTEADLPAIHALGALPVLYSPELVRAWGEISWAAGCALMIDTGINRLGLSFDDWEALLEVPAGLRLLMSHLACADEPGRALNQRQLERLQQGHQRCPEVPTSLANSAGIFLGRDYHGKVTRPGISLYGGTPVPDAETVIQSVVSAQAQILQLRTVRPGESIGYNATWTATQPSRLATLGAGYADGYGRGFSNRGEIIVHGLRCPIIGRVSMDLIVADVTDIPQIRVGDWATLLGDGITLANAAQWSGLAQYEILTGLGQRYERSYKE